MYGLVNHEVWGKRRKEGAPDPATYTREDIRRMLEKYRKEIQAKKETDNGI